MDTVVEGGAQVRSIRVRPPSGLTRRDLLRLGALGAAGLAGALPRPAKAQTAAAPRDLVVGLSGDLSTFDPGFVVQTVDISINFNIFDTLTTRHADLKLHPQLATEWKNLSDTTWQVKLRRGVRFHNGDPLTARDVKFSIERTYDPAANTRVATALSTIDRIETPDDYTVTFITKRPDPLLPARFSIVGGQIIPAAHFTKVGADAFKTKPVGSGPLQLVEWVPSDHTTLKRFDGYWGEKCPFERVIVKPIPETATRMAAFLAGEAHIVTKVPPDYLDRIKASRRGRIESVPYQGLYVLAVNSRVPPLDNKLVKQALSWAIDRATIIKTLYSDQATMVNGVFLDGDFAYDPSLPPSGFDPGRAKELLRQGGYKQELIILESSTNVINERALGEAIISMWRDVGVNARLEIIEMSVRSQKYRERSFKGLWLADPTDFLFDPDGMMWRLLGPKGLFDYWRHPEFDSLGDEARFSIDAALRQRNYRRMHQLLLEYLPWIPVLRPIELYGVANTIDWRPYGNQFIELRGYNLKARSS
jgi:peptide/nickel transport system substrate-binding protein